MNKKSIAKKRLKLEMAAKTPASALNVPAPQESPLALESSLTDISTMDHASGLSGMPAQSGQR